MEGRTDVSAEAMIAMVSKLINEKNRSLVNFKGKSGMKNLTYLAKVVETYM
jgi:hypothetical protein